MAAPFFRCCIICCGRHACSCIDVLQAHPVSPQGVCSWMHLLCQSAGHPKPPQCNPSMVFVAVYT